MFYIKKRNIITLLYSRPFHDSLHDLIIEQVQKSVQNFQEPISKIYFSNNIDWFGRNKSELVIKIHDPSHYLHKLRDCILKGLQGSKPTTDQSLYDTLAISDANKFDFTPHESIGRIDIQKIEQLSNHEVIETIKHKIAHALKEIIDTMHQFNEIIPSQLELYGNEFKTIAMMHIA